MNRHARRAAAARARQVRLYPDLIRHFPQVPLDAPLALGRVHYLVRGHLGGCGLHTGGRCTCTLRLPLHVEPVRQ